MVLLDKFMDLFCDHAAVVNTDEKALNREVELLREKYGPWTRIRGFIDYHQLFFALHLAKEKNRPFSKLYIKESDVEIEAVIKKANLDILTYTYHNTQDLMAHLPAMR